MNHHKNKGNPLNDQKDVINFGNLLNDQRDVKR